MCSKKFALLILFVLLSLLAAAVSVKADTLYLNGVNGRVDVTGRVYITPYYGGLNKPSGMDNIYCLDPNNDSYLNTHWDVNVTLLDTNTALSNTYLGNSGRTQYEEVAWLLFYQTASNGATYGAPTMLLNDQQDIQAAIWWIINPGNTYGRNNPWVTQASLNYAGGDYSNVYILTPTTTPSNQEFIIKVAELDTFTLFLLGTALLAIWEVWKKARKT